MEFCKVGRDRAILGRRQSMQRPRDDKEYDIHGEKSQRASG